jgi:hypothetical protein
MSLREFLEFPRQYSVRWTIGDRDTRIRGRGREKGDTSTMDCCAYTKRHHIAGMTSDNILPSTYHEFPHRLIVKARSRSGANKGYFWEIVRDNEACSVVQQCLESYRSMAEAYTFGSVILTQTLLNKTATRRPERQAHM